MSATGPTGPEETPPRTSDGEVANELGEKSRGASDGLDRDGVRQALGALSTLLPVGLFAADAEGGCWYVNQRLIHSLGIEIRSRDDRPFRLDLPVSAAATTAPSPARLEVGLRSGHTVPDAGAPLGESLATPLDVRVMPIISRSGATLGYLGVVVDPDDPEQALALRTSERLVDALVDRSPELVTVLNADGSWRYSNAAAWRLLGYQADFDPADGILGLVHADDMDIVVAAIDRLVAREGDGKPIEVRVRAKDGSWRYLESVAENLLDDPVVNGFLIRSRDVTERRQARLALLEANERLSTLISSLHLAVLMEDEHRRIVFTNEAFVTLFEVPLRAGDLVGKTVAELRPHFFRHFGDPTRVPSEEQVDQMLRERRPVVGDRIGLPDDRVIERDYLPIIVGGEYRGHVWLFRDVSAQARAEAAWELLISRQQRENERLVQLDRVKAAFLAEISHELRTPLTSILSFTELLAEGVGRDDPAEQTELLEVIKRNAERLLRLVDDLLLLDRLESGAMTLELGAVDLPSLVSAAVAGFVPAAQAKSISIACEVGEGPAIPGDGVRLAQVIDVLLSNAVKFTPEGGRIAVAATPRDRLWRIEVSDSGIGVPLEEQDALFERFYRATNARASRIPGSGLGLPVARAIVELHGGSIVVRSRQGSGTTVTVTLPVPVAGSSPEALGDGGAVLGEQAAPERPPGSDD